MFLDESKSLYATVWRVDWIQKKYFYKNHIIEDMVQKNVELFMRKEQLIYNP